MAELPLEPNYGKAVIISKQYNCFDEMLSIVSMFSSENIFLFPKGKREQVAIARNRYMAIEGDHLTLLNVYEAYCEAKDKKKFCIENFLHFRSMNKVDKVREQLVQYTGNLFGASLEAAQVKTRNREAELAENILKCLTHAFILQIACLQDDGKYKTIRENKEAFIHPTSCLFGKKKPKYVIYNEMVS